MRNNDHVSYELKGISQGIIKYSDQACYSAFSFSYLYEHYSYVICTPYDSNGISRKEYTHLIRLLRKNKILPPKTIIPKRKDNCLKINLGKTAKKVNLKIYMTLCFYRWQEFRPEIIRFLLETCTKNPKISFFQALAYTMVKKPIYVGHSFLHTPYLVGGKFNLVPYLIYPYLLAKSPRIEEDGVSEFQDKLELKLDNIYAESPADILNPKWKKYFSVAFVKSQI